MGTGLRNSGDPSSSLTTNAETKVFCFDINSPVLVESRLRPRQVSPFFRCTTHLYGTTVDPKSGLTIAHNTPTQVPSTFESHVLYTYGPVGRRVSTCRYRFIYVGSVRKWV